VYEGIKDSVLDITVADNKQLLVESGAKYFCRNVWDTLQFIPCGFLKPFVARNKLYEGVSKMFWTVAAIYTAVVVARSTGRWYNYHV
jgi:hypothetical protein